MADALTGVVRYLHIFTAIMWVGGLFLWGMLLAPTLTRRVPPQAAGPVMRTLVPRLSRYFSIAGIAAILSGMWLIYLIWDSPDAGYRVSTGGYGIAMTLGLVGSLAMITIALAIIIPASNKLLALPPPTAGTAPPTEAAGLQKRLMMGSMTNMALGTLVLATMVWAVNVFR